MPEANHAIWLENTAVSWGWFVDATPGDDAEFTTPGDQGEQGRMGLLTVLAHEIGHLLGHDHGEQGALATGDVMIDTLATGIRRMPDTDVDWLATVELVFADDLFSGQKHLRNKW